MTSQPEKSETLYFNCRAPEAQQDEAERTRSSRATSGSTKTTCIIQVAVHGSESFSDGNSETECTNGRTLVEVIPDSGPKKVVKFRCADQWTLSPVNFEKTLDGEQCTTEQDLADLHLDANRVEGKSYKEGSQVPAYALEISEFPTGKDHVKLCYKCTKNSEGALRTSDQNDNECTIIVDVAPKKSPTGENDEEEQPIEHPSTSDSRDHHKSSFVTVGAFLLCSVLAAGQFL
ncbi:SAG-related sequence SRS47C [Toxoplasma gondii TgCatPRC2]|uniref:SAG-related sequence SRS47C n=3 Tax=Toxoplasma gondii TaxID=5811 RepID=A0A151H110_TOXGO|nr:SAG-related sequence SRS47C [Toxoplasma gondii ME49]EPT26410.1 SAG-related sequence SRS47C [Toxoplasma gondii ME49]KFG36246.1 SAG-related sequence SRS47C [Toxoplasma gondii GAB2-2007-GAL-DOM2]KYK63029.1 SAG-related sequence SRS47C [Toxoplasma gondii TgCatPRC2]|eukprot:XP_002371932.1 SAG-related sequence SRS47C [Toxoplasma gondii ME49]